MATHDQPSDPHPLLRPLILLPGAVFLAAAVSWVLPAGMKDRAVDEATGRTVVVSGTFHAVDPAPVGPFDALVAMPRGMIHVSGIIFLVFLIGGIFPVVDSYGCCGGGCRRWFTGWETSGFSGSLG